MILQTIEHFDLFKQWIAKQSFVALDIETSGLDSVKDHIIGIGVSSANSGYYLPLMAFDGTQLQTLPTAQFVTEFLNLIQTKNLICFNGAFDLPFIEAKYPVQFIKQLHTDVLLLKHTVDEDFPFKLKEIAVQVFGYGASSPQKDLHAELQAAGASKHEIYKANMQTIGKYCIQDCVLTYRLYNFYLPKLKDQKLEQFFYIDEVMPLYREVTIPMEQTGIKINAPLMRQTLSEIISDIEQLEAKIQAAVKPLLAKFEQWWLDKEYPVSRSGNFAQGIAQYAKLDLPKTDTGKFSLTAKTLAKLPESIYKDVLLKKSYLPPEDCLAVQKLLAESDHGSISHFNLQSKHHLKKLFFDTLGETPLSTTDLGAPQVNDYFLDLMATKHSFAADLQIYNKLQKIKSTYIERFLDAEQDGIFYPSFFQHRTVSGRLAGDFQQLPRPIKGDSIVAKYTNLIRGFFVARPGRVFVDADYNSAEPRVFAYVSGDPELKKYFNNQI